MTNNKNLQRYWEELLEWTQGSDFDGNLEYAVANDYTLHAVAIWINSGASTLSLPVKIDRDEEMKEIKALCESADIFICPDCNHHAYYIKGELDSTPECMSCGNNSMKLREDSND